MKSIINKIFKQQDSMHIRIFVVIIITAITIVVFGLIVNNIFLTNSITRILEEDMKVAVELADKYVTSEIETLKLIAADAAREIFWLYQTGESNILERITSHYTKYIGMAVFNSNGMLDSWGDLLLPPDLSHEPFMLTAFNGGQEVSTTMFTLDGTLVMYVSAPVDDDVVLAAVLPGLYFSECISEFTFWQTGHLFIYDEDGYSISNFRHEWAQQRINFIELKKINSSYAEIGGIIQRGINGESGIGYFSLDGESRICAYHPVSSQNENWLIGIVAPLAESALSSIPGAMLLMGVITMIMSIIAALVASGLLKRPYEEVNRLRREAEIASISKSTFLANMSHEIRTPMNSIVGFSELAMDDDISDKTKDYLVKIQANSEWLLQIINNILDISKIESGKMELEKIPFDVHELFASCRTLILPIAAEKGIMLYFYSEPSMKKKLLGDPTRLRQVFINLLSNSIKFTNAGMVKLSSEIIKSTEDKITMRFEIKDSGIGMTKEQIAKVFQPFIQAESGTTRKYGGTGLGLSITKNILDIMGGKFVVESTPGLGSKFRFEITFDAMDINDEEIQKRKAFPIDIERPVFEGEILLCEDNSMNQQVICEHLSRIGLKTVVADNGKIGLNMIKERIKNKEKQFDLIFMDMHMPVMDGLEASAAIMKLGCSVPIVALTANIMSNNTEIYKEHNIIDYVGKPFTSQELWRCLLKYFTPLNKSNSDAKVSKSLQMLEADTEFMNKLNILFVENNRNKYEEIVKAINDGDIKLAHRLAHTLKSNAGQIGKTALQEAAFVVEKQLKDEKNTLSAEQLKAFENELIAVLAELSPLAEEASKNKKAKQNREFIEPQKALETLNELEPLLKGGNPDSLNFIDILYTIENCEELSQHIEAFEFEAAYAALVKIKERMA